MKELNCRNFLAAGAAKFIYMAAPGGAPEGAESERQQKQKAEVAREIDSYLKRIDENQSDPRQIESIIEEALARLAEKHKEDIDKARDAQRTALGLLVDRACDIDGDGKVNTPQEKQLRAQIDSAMSGVLGEINTAAGAAKYRIDGIGRDAATYGREAREGAGAWNSLEDADDPKVRGLYAKFEAAKKALADQRAAVGLKDGEKNDADAVRAGLRRLADNPGEQYEYLRRAKEDGHFGEVVDQVVADLGALSAGINTARNELIAAVDQWKAGAVAGIRERYGKGGEVDARELAARIDAAKVAILEKRGKERAVATVEGRDARAVEAARARRDSAKGGLDKAERVRDAAQARVDEAAAVLAAKKAEYGLDPDAKVTEQSVREGLRALAQRTGQKYEYIRRAQEDGDFPALIDQVLQELSYYDNEHNRAWTVLKARRSDADAAEARLATAEGAVDKAHDQADLDVRVAEATPVDVRGDLARRSAERRVARIESEKQQREAVAARAPKARPARAASTARKAVEVKEAPKTNITHVVAGRENDYTIVEKYFGRGARNSAGATALLLATYGSVDKIPKLKTGKYAGKDVLLRTGDKLRIPPFIMVNGKRIDRIV